MSLGEMIVCVFILAELVDAIAGDA